jgi:hypothetical protein
MTNWIVTSVRNSTGVWEAIDRERTTATSLVDVEVAAQDIGSEPGQAILIELLDNKDAVLASVETTTT